jgi:hypothetical protein
VEKSDLFATLIPQCSISRTKTMMKQKGKMLVKHVEKPVKKETMFKVKESKKM